jgi:hypothetical protein
VVTAEQRRQAVRLLRAAFGVSDRRACRVRGQLGSTQRQLPKRAKEGQERLVAWILELVRPPPPRCGYRRIWARRRH